MQLMTWTIARLGGRFNLLFEPYRQRVMHSALGRFLDAPLDLMVGLVEPDGTERVLPLTARGSPLFNCEQFERLNSITFRGYSERYRLRFEFNIHSVFYPQHEPLCLSPAFYLEMRVNPSSWVCWHTPTGPVPDKVKLFIRLDRPDTRITATDGRASPTAHDRAWGPHIDLEYRNSLNPDPGTPVHFDRPANVERTVQVRERIVSLNPDATAEPDGKGLVYEIPVTEPGSGIKWRMVWAAYCGDPVLDVKVADAIRPARFHYIKYWSGLDQVLDEAIGQRDDWLAHSRRFEKLIDQTPLTVDQRHLINQSFQAFASSAFWCDLDEPGGKPAAQQPVEVRHDPTGTPVAGRGAFEGFGGTQWFSVWEGGGFYHSTIDGQYNVALLYLALWPQLLALQFSQWAEHETLHQPSGGSYLCHDLGSGPHATGQAYPHAMPVEENANFLLLMQTYCRWTGDLTVPQRHTDLIERLANYLLWTDRDQSGFPAEGTANSIDDAGPAMQYARKQTYLAVKRLAALRAAADLLGHMGRHELAERCDKTADADAAKVDRQAWLADHYSVCVDRSAVGLQNAWTGEPLPYDEIAGWDAYSIYTGNGLLLPAMIGQPPLLDNDRLVKDLINATRETLGPYGCCHSSTEPNHVWISQNIWRDHLARYLGHSGSARTNRYWDLQVMSNTGRQSRGFVDTYVSNNVCFGPRGITSIGFLLSYPRLTIDKLAPGGTRISVEPDRHCRQRWPLLPLADWKAGKIPVCVVDADGTVTIEGAVDPIIIRGGEPAETELIG